MWYTVHKGDHCYERKCISDKFICISYRTLLRTILSYRLAIQTWSQGYNIYCILADRHSLQFDIANKKPQAFPPAVFFYLPRYFSGSTGLPSASNILKSRCGPVDMPVFPEDAICCPCATVSPTLTFHESR